MCVCSSKVITVLYLPPTHTLEHVPIDVCFVPELRRSLPNRPFFTRKKVPQGLPLKDVDRDRIFEMAKNTDNFYHIMVQLQVSGLLIM